MRTPCPACEGYYDGIKCACGYTVNVSRPIPGQTSITPSSPPVTDQERAAFMAEFRQTIAVLTSSPPEPRPLPPPHVLADHYQLLGGAMIPTDAHPEIRACGCVYDTKKTGTAGSPVLLASCPSCRDAEDALLTSAAKEAHRPLAKHSPTRKPTPRRRR